MAITSPIALRRFSGFAISLLLFSLCCARVAVGQGTPPPVTASAPAGLTHPTGWGGILQTAITPKGDWLVVDWVNSSLYEFPAGGQAAISPMPPQSLGSKAGYQNPTLLLDPANNIYLGGNWNNCLLEFNYNPATNTWPTLSALSSSSNSASLCGTAPYSLAQYSIFGFAPYYFQPWGVALGTSNNIIVGSQASPNGIFSMNIQGAWSSPNVPQNSSSTVSILAKMNKRPNSIAVDPEGDIFFVEDGGTMAGLYEIPASAPIPLATDADPSIVRVDANLPTTLLGVTSSGNLPSVVAVVTDATGTLYVSDSKAGIYVIPNPLGVLQPSGAYLLSPVPSTGEVAIDAARGVVYTPTSQTQSNGQADVAAIGITHAELGSSKVGTAVAAPATINYEFNGNAIPDRAVIVENGGASSDFKITSGGTCAFSGVGTGYTAGQSCTVQVSMTPHAVGSLSAMLLLQKSDPVASTDKDFSDAITGYSQSSTTLTLTSANHLVAGEAIVIHAATKTDPLNSLDGQEFFVLPSVTSSQVQLSSAASNAIPNGASGTTGATVQARKFTTMNSFVLHGTGVGWLEIEAGPSLEAALGSGLKNPSQVALDGNGNVYVADAGLGKVLSYAAGSGGWSTTASSIGTGLTAPTGVAVDGTGNIFIADSSKGNVYEIPALPGDGLNVNPGQQTLLTGLGANLRLAIDGSGNLYIADPSNSRVVKLVNPGSTQLGVLGQTEVLLTAGLTGPTAVTVDSNFNLYVVDGSNLFEFVGGSGSPVTLSSSLSGATGVGVDASGALYISATGGTMRVPYVSGAYAFGSPTTVAGTVTGPSAVALDQWGNVYLADTTALNIHVVSTSGTLTFAPFTTPGQSAALKMTVTNAGNAPLSVTGYTASLVYVVKNTQNPKESVTVQDFWPADGTCVSASPVAVGSNCQVQVTMYPGPGEEGALSGQLGFTGNAANIPLIQASGVGAALPGSKTTVTVASGAEVVNTTVNVAVTAKTGTGIPQGQIVVSYTSFYVDVPATGPNAGVPTIEPNLITLSKQLDSTGKASFTVAPTGFAPVDYSSPQPFMGGSQNLSVIYVGDPAYSFGRSSTAPATSIAKSQIAGLGKDTNPPAYLPFVLEQSGSTPYDGSQTFWQYNMPETVNTPLGTPTGTLTFMDNSTACPPGTSATGQGKALCALTGYSGVACPLSKQSFLVRSAGVANSARTTFTSSCLPMPLNTTYTPVVSTHYITPVYSGDANYVAYQGVASDSYVFQALRSPMVIITEPSQNGDSTAAAKITVAKGGSATTNLTLTSLLGYGYAGKGGQLNDYNFPVTLSCDNLPPHSACTFTYPTTVNPIQPTAPNSVQIPCTGTSPSAANCVPGIVTLTINTNVTVGTTTSQNAAFASITLASLFGFGMVGIFFRRRAFEKGRRMLIVLLVIVGGALTLCITACNTTNLAPNAVLNSPSGTYPVTVTAQQVGAQTISLPTGPVQVYGSEDQISVPFYINVTVQ